MSKDFGLEFNELYLLRHWWAVFWFSKQTITQTSHCETDKRIFSQHPGCSQVSTGNLEYSLWPQWHPAVRFGEGLKRATTDKKPSWMFSMLLAKPKDNFAGPAFLALFSWEGEQQDITLQEAKWSSFVLVFFRVVLQGCALVSSDRRAVNVQEMDWVLLGLFCFVMMLLYTSLDSTNNTVLANLLWLSQVCQHWMLLCVWNHKLSSLIWRNSSL